MAAKENVGVTDCVAVVDVSEAEKRFSEDI
jgi:hypothetical protein